MRSSILSRREAAGLRPVWLLALLPTVCGLLLSMWAYLQVQAFHRQQLRQQFESLANEHLSRFSERLQERERDLHALRRFFQMQGDDPQTFERFASPMLDENLVFAWAPRLTISAGDVPHAAQLAAFTAQARARVGSDFVLREAGLQGGLLPLGERSSYFPMLYGAARENVGLPLGLDMASPGPRREGLELAIRRGQISATKVLRRTMGEERDRLSILLFIPIYSVGAVPELASLRGMLFSGLGVRQLLEENVSPGFLEALAVEVHDPELGPNSLVYAYGQAAEERTLLLVDEIDNPLWPYQMYLRPTSEFYRRAAQPMGVPVLLSGISLSLLLGVLLMTMLGQRQRALRLVAERTAELQGSREHLQHINARLNNLLEAASEVLIISMDSNGQIRSANSGAERLLGLPRQMLEQSSIEAVLDNRQLALSAGLDILNDHPTAVLEALLAHHYQASLDTLLRRHDGAWLPVTLMCSTISDGNGGWDGYLLIAIDTSERQRILAALEERSALLARLGAQVPGCIYQFQLHPDGHTSMPYASTGLQELFEVLPEQVLQDAQVTFERIHPEDRARIEDSIADAAHALSRWQSDFRVLLPRRGQRWLHADAVPERLIDGSVIWYGYVSDISNLKQVEEELRTLTITDALTGIHNRRFFLDQLEHELARQKRTGQQLSLLLLDIDHFKRVNDTYGHDVGDQVLQALCQCIKTRLRRLDVFCRFGGEEFVIICPETGLEAAVQLAEQLRERVASAPFEQVGTITISLGVSTARVGDTSGSLLQRADQSMYAAKQSGRNRVCDERSLNS